MAEKGGSADEQKPVIDMSSLADALPGGKASGHSGLVNALKDKLQTLVGTSSGYIESLPPKIKKRVETLQKMQAEHDELLSKFLEEKAALEAKYQNMYEPLYSKRHDIVNGITDIEDNKEEKTAQASKKDNIEEKGVPEFWRTAMTNNEILRVQITERDEDALKFLKDIKWSRLDDEKGFKLDFFFNENPYFKNTVLTKIYYMVDENEPILERVTGTEIDWFPGKKLTEKVMRKKLKKGAKSGKTVTRVEQCASFFNFFKPPQIPDDDEDLDDDLADDLQDLLEQDYDIGSTIRDKIIPRAVSWYTGEAVETDDEDDEEDDEEDEDEDDDEDEDEDEENKEDDEEEDDHEDKDHVNLKPIHDYRLYKQITKRDEDALKFLKDIRWSRLDDGKGFKLDFFFDENPYFKNTVLTKSYYMDENERILEGVTGSITGTEIDWFPGKKLTEKVMRKKLKKGAKSGKTVTRVEQCASFFHFFEAPPIPDDDDDDVVADNFTLDDNHQALLKQDYDIGRALGSCRN